MFNSPIDKRVLHVALFLITLFTIGCDTKKVAVSHLNGKVLLKQNCASCHNLDMPPKTFKDEKAPPIMAVSFHILDLIKANSPAEKVPNAIEFVVNYTRNPTISKSFCDKESLKSYGLMPSLEGKVSQEELRAIAGYIFSHYTKDNLLAQMKLEQKIREMPKGRLLSAKYGCLNCHAKKFKKLGPSFNQIAKKLTASQIKNSISNGSRGKWKECNNILMPSFPKMQKRDLTTIANWILKVKN